MFCALSVIFLYFFFPFAVHTRYAWAQGNQGAIEGIVVDVSGAPVPGAHLVVRNLATGVESDTQSDADGHFSFPTLLAGNYSVEVEKNGFVTTKRKVKVTAGKRANLRLQMKVAPPDNILDLSYSINRHEVTDIAFLDSRFGWILLHDKDKNFLFKTDDGGESWSSNRILKGIVTICFVSPRLGWALRSVKSRGRYFSYLFRTRDGGSVWKQTMTRALEANLAPEEFVVRMAFSDDKSGWFFTSGNRADLVLLTRDAGRSADKVSHPLDDDQDYRGIFALPSGRVWVFGAENIRSTNDWGKTWEQQFNWVQPRLNSLQTIFDSSWFFPDGHGWLVGQEIDEGIVLATQDFGHHWQRVFESYEPPDLDSVYFSDENNGCTVGLQESLVCTQDGGATWTSRRVLPLPSDNQANFFVKIVMLKSGRGFVLRAGGFLYETEDGGQTWHEFDPLSAAPK